MRTMNLRAKRVFSPRRDCCQSRPELGDQEWKGSNEFEKCLLGKICSL